MKFDDIYPYADYLDTNGDMVKSNKQKPCWHCGELTSWVEINFMAYLCSEECYNAKWQEYIEATKK